MTNPEREIDLGFTKEILPESPHICLIYDDDEQRRTIVSQYLAAGIRGGEVARYVTDGTPTDEVRAWMSAAGVDGADEHRFTVLDAERFYCPDGRFDPDHAIGRMIPRYEADRQAGHNGSRVSSEMSWALRDIPGARRWLEYESRINTVKSTFRHSGMCQYDARRFDGASLFRVLQVHPYMIAQGRIVRNPFYVRPEELVTTSL